MKNPALSLVYARGPLTTMLGGVVVLAGLLLISAFSFAIATVLSVALIVAIILKLAFQAWSEWSTTVRQWFAMVWSYIDLTLDFFFVAQWERLRAKAAHLPLELDEHYVTAAGTMCRLRQYQVLVNGRKALYPIFGFCVMKNGETVALCWDRLGRCVEPEYDIVAKHDQNVSHWRDEIYTKS